MTNKRSYIFWLTAPVLISLLIFGIFGFLATQSWEEAVKEEQDQRFSFNILTNIGEWGIKNNISVLLIFLIFGVIMGLLITGLRFKGKLGYYPNPFNDDD